MKYNSWCNDRPMKAIMQEVLSERNGWKNCPNGIYLDILENTLKNTQDYIR